MQDPTVDLVFTEADLTILVDQKDWSINMTHLFQQLFMVFCDCTWDKWVSHPFTRALELKASQGWRGYTLPPNRGVQECAPLLKKVKKDGKECSYVNHQLAISIMISMCDGSSLNTFMKLVLKLVARKTVLEYDSILEDTRKEACVTMSSRGTFKDLYKEKTDKVKFEDTPNEYFMVTPEGDIAC